MPRHLFIVSRETPYLADYLREQFSDEPDVEVFVDRRRLVHQAPGSERRELSIDRELRECFHVMVTIDGVDNAR